ncbi:hypothetical protein V8G54_018957 [Vigna mungo]|uniref:Uncharacterized protein n=1 Tax=Vigna mungo TaxID=3915 RepID=A0AAQ3RV86_VIGMU
MYLSFVVHGDLNENHWVRRVSQLYVVLHWLPFVTFLGLSPEQLHQSYDNAHVDPLNEHHHRHDQAQKHCQSQQRDNQWRFDLIPNQCKLCGEVIFGPLERFRDNGTGRKTIHWNRFDVRRRKESDE